MLLLLLLLFLGAKLVIAEGDVGGEVVLFGLLIGVVVCGICVLAGLVSEQVVVIALVVVAGVALIGDGGIFSGVE